MKKAIIFDMDGVLIDSEVIHMDGIEKFLISFGLEMTDTLRGKLIGASPQLTRLFLAEIWPRNISEDEISKYLDEVYQKLQIDYLEILNKDAEALLKRIKEAGIQIALASSSSRKTIDKVLHQTALEEYFEITISGEEVADSKPHPDIYLKAIEQMNCLRKDCIIVEDSEYGIEAAVNAGIEVIAIQDSRMHIDQSRADFIVNTLNDIFPIVTRENMGVKGIDYED